MHSLQQFGYTGEVETTGSVVAVSNGERSHRFAYLKGPRKSMRGLNPLVTVLTVHCLLSCPLYAALSLGLARATTSDAYSKVVSTF